MTVKRVFRRAVVCAIARDSGGKVLLHQRSDNGHWGLPGGAIEIGETAAQTVLREVLEETGLTAEIVRLSGVYSEPSDTTITYPEGDTAAYVALAFLCRPTGGELATCDESLNVQWFEPTQLPAPFYRPHGIRISDAISGNGTTIVR